MSRVAVSKPVLNWAIHRSGKPLQLLRERFAQLEDWQSGLRQPTLRQLEDLSKATLTPLGFFFLDEPPEDYLPVPFFRTANGGHPPAPSVELLNTVHAMQLRQAWARDYLVAEGQEPLRLVRFIDRDQQPGQIAPMLREVLGLADGWAARRPSWQAALRQLERAMESAGIIVVVNGVVGNNTHRRLDPSEFRGFVLVDEFAPLVFVNGADGKAAQMFTLAHELAHLAFGQSAAFDLRRLQAAEEPIERACNRVAAEFLVPEQEFRTQWDAATRTKDPFQAVAHNFKVSRIVAARRALDLGLISLDRFLEFYAVYEQEVRQQASKDDSGSGNFWNTQGTRVGRLFGSFVVSAVQEGKLGYSEAFQLTGLYGPTFDKFASFFGPEGRHW